MTLSWAELNRAVLARQLLLERAPLDPVAAAERVGGLQTQYAPSAYVGLWSRLVDFRRADLTSELLDGRVVQRITHACTIRPSDNADVRSARRKRANRDHSPT